MSPHDYADRQSESVADGVTAMKLEPDRASDTPNSNGGSAVIKDDPDRPSNSPPPTMPQNNGSTALAAQSRSVSGTPVKTDEPLDEHDGHDSATEERIGGDITVKLEPGQPPKLTRSSSQKVVPRPPQLFSHLPDSTAEARSTFELMETCTYANKYMGYTEHAMECDCAEEWGKICSPLFFVSFPSRTCLHAPLSFPRVPLHLGSQQAGYCKSFKFSLCCRLPLLFYSSVLLLLSRFPYLFYSVLFAMKLMNMRANTGFFFFFFFSL